MKSKDIPSSGQTGARPSDTGQRQQILSSSKVKFTPLFPVRRQPPSHPTDESPGSRHASLALTCVEPGSPALQESPLQPEGKGAEAPGALHPEQLPPGRGDSGASAACSSWFSRICVQCTSAWISRGSARFSSCCSLLGLPTRGPGSRGGGERGREDGKKEGRKTGECEQSRDGGSRHHRTGNRGKVTIFARISMKQKQAKTENQCMCAHTHTHTRLLLIQCDSVPWSLST